MIFGIGTDILNTHRIAKTLEKHSQRFAEKVLSATELDEYAKKTTHKSRVNYLAKRWAAKEAFAKACGTGLREPVLFTNISLTNDSLGKPIITTAPVLAQWMSDNNIGDCHVSLSDEKDNVVAFVVLERLS